jgi:hypothetical protein
VVAALVVARVDGLPGLAQSGLETARAGDVLVTSDPPFAGPGDPCRMSRAATTRMRVDDRWG